MGIVHVYFRASRADLIAIEKSVYQLGNED